MAKWTPYKATAAAGTVAMAFWASAADIGMRVGDTPTRARAPDGRYISWREHIIDDAALSDVPISGSDGLTVGDLDRDGRLDIVSVHESDTRYDGRPEGHIRIAFGAERPDRWHNITLAEGAEAAAAEDAAIADVNGDGYPDIIAACELAHLIYLQNPGAPRKMRWPRLILPQTRERGSYIRVFFADFDGDGTPEAVAANKGSQNPGVADFEARSPISVFRVVGDPLAEDGWQEIELGRYSVPQNAEPVDLDGDGDLEVIGGSRGERRLIVFENIGGSGAVAFREHSVRLDDAQAGGFNLDYEDFNGDGRLDIVAATTKGLAWLEQPAVWSDIWPVHVIGDLAPDTVTGIAVADVDGDGDSDVFAGSYSRGPRDADGNVGVGDSLGRLGWFENPGDAARPWLRHDVSRRKRGMFDKFVGWDIDGDGDLDFAGTRGNSAPYDGVFWLEQVRTAAPVPAFQRARAEDSQEMPLPPSR